MGPRALDTATRFAAALDREDYATARGCLAAGCTYRIRGRTLRGPDAIIESYRSSGDSANDEFESVEYESRATACPDGTVRVAFVDHFGRHGRSHTYTCVQSIVVGADGRIVEIEHIDLPGETESLDRFLSAV